MRITDLLKEEGIELNGAVSTKEAAIDQMVELMVRSGNIADKETYKKGVFAREAEGTTGIGDGIAIPHAKTNAVKRAGLSAMVVKDGVDYDSLDEEPVYLIFLIAAPDTKENVHLDVLSRLSTLLMDEEFIENLKKAKTRKEFLNYINEAENAKFCEEDKKEKPNQYRVLAVTACPTGIAHTYMAAESLEKKAAELGVTIKVETNGSGGAKNVLTAEEIKNADCIIIAADKTVEMARFDGKKVIQTTVSKGISKAKDLIQEAIGGAVNVYHYSGAVKKENSHSEKESIGRIIYKHLMNGVSHMLPFVVGGGILIALAFVLDDYTIDPSNFGMNTPLAAFFKSVGGMAFGFMLPILSGFIAMSIADRPGLAVGFVGGALAGAGNTFASPTGGIPSGFLGALLAGFIAGYLVLGLRKLCDKLPKSLEGIKPVLIYPLVGIFAIGAVMVFAVNPPVGAFNTWLNDMLNSMGSTSKAVLGLVLGGMMSIDFGGPFNKAAYVFGTASIASGQFDIMAAVMIGGMVPPLAIALATVIFRNKFTKSEKQSGLTNFIMGLSFITEGAIPFAAADPLRVIPSCCIGSAIAGCLSMVFQCTLRAPHGGIFVFPVVDNAAMYVVSLLVGSAVGAVLLGILKKPVQE